LRIGRNESDCRVKVGIIALPNAAAEAFLDIVRVGEHDEQIVLAPIDLE
jgi:hypothetical protein